MRHPYPRPAIVATTVALAALAAVGSAQPSPSSQAPTPHESTPGDGPSAGAGAGAATASDASITPGAADAPTDGSYQLVDPEATDRTARATIDAAIAALHPSMRDAFRAQLSASSRAPRRLTLARDGEALVVGWDGREVRAVLGAAAASATGPEGRRVDVRHSLDAGAYLLRYGHTRMTRSTRVTRTPSGLLVTTELRTGLLPRPLSFEARYTPS